MTPAPGAAGASPVRAPARDTPQATAPGEARGRVGSAPRRRSLLVVLAAGALALLAVVLGTARGDVDLPPAQVLSVLLGGGDQVERFVVLELRLPRALVGLLVGLALGAAGAITQAVSRNPLASPDVLGVTAGASAAAVGVLVLAPAAGTLVGVPLAALAGGMLAAAAVHLLAWRDGLDGFRLVLVGVGVAAFGTALTSWMLVSAQIEAAAQATLWLTGSLNARGWDHVVPVALALALFGALALPAAYPLRALVLGDDSAASLGVRVNAARAALLLVAVALASVATASAGPVPFVALVAPQLALRLVRSGVPPLLASGVVGAVLLTGADLLARTALPVPLPVGVVTGVVGAPYLLHLIRRRSREASA